MKLLPTARSLALASALVLSFVAAGCQSSRVARIKENPALFRSLSPFHQKVVQDGFIDYGFSSEVVRMSLGRPSRMTVKNTSDGQVETWIYRNFIPGTPGPTRISAADFDPLQAGGPLIARSTIDGPGFGDPRTGRAQTSPSHEIAAPVGILVVELLEDCVVRIRFVR